MIDGKPNYTRLSTIAMADVVLMDEEGRNQFINALCEMFENVMVPDYQPEEKPGFVGRAIQRQFAEFREGTKKYMDNVNRNPSGGPSQGENTEHNPAGDPMGAPVGKQAETPKEQEQETEREQEPKQEKKKRNTSIPPTVDEVRAYCEERKNRIDPEYFVTYYEARGWYLKSGQKMKDWKAGVRHWEQIEKKGGGNSGNNCGNSPANAGNNRPDYSCIDRLIHKM